MSKFWCGLAHRVGHRGAALLALGTLDFVYGWTKMLHPDPVSASSQQMQLLAQIFPLADSRQSIAVWGVLWWVAGAVCLFNAFRRDDRWGYAAALLIKTSWVLGNIYAWDHGLVGGGSIVAIWTFALIVAFLFAIRPESVPELEEAVEQFRRNGHTGEFGRPEGGADDGA